MIWVLMAPPAEFAGGLGHVGCVEVGAGEALVEMERPTGGPLANHPVHVLLQVAGATVLEEMRKVFADAARLQERIADLEHRIADEPDERARER